MGAKKGLLVSPGVLPLASVVVDHGVEVAEEIVLREGESLTMVLLPTGDAYRRRLTVVLQGDDSHVELLGLVLGRGEASLGLELTTIHQGRGTTAYTWVRTALFDKSTLKFSGMIKIEKGANKTLSLLESRVLILGKGARAESVPSLEIEADDVRASHAATVGKIDEAALFYLASRGIERERAVQMVVEGFFQTLLQRVNNKEALKEVRHYLWQNLLEPSRQKV